MPIAWLAALALLIAAPAAAADAPDCADHPLFTRMPNFEIYHCTTVDFDAVDFPRPGLKQWEKAEDFEAIEGKVFAVSYGLKEGSTPPSALQIIRNFQNAAKSGGGTVVADYKSPFAAELTETARKFMTDSPGGTSYDRYTILKFVKNGTEYLVNIAASDAYHDYSVLVVERKAMAQEVSVNALVAQLNTVGFIALYVNFDTNKATIRPDSAATLDEAAAVLKAAPALQVLVGGHTDNVGTPEANQALSAARANAVMAALVARGIGAARLTAQGFGQTLPIADNRTEEGRAKNRRVELVKK